VNPHRTIRLFTVRWVAAFFLGIGAIVWMCAAAGASVLVNAGMSMCWGYGVSRMAIWDRNRLLRKLMGEQQERISK
jgi:hypothetical protein